MKKTLKSISFLSFLILISWQSIAQQRQISGEVFDESNLPIPGVSVQIKGTTLGSTTDFNGAFSIMLPQDGTSILRFSYIGFKTEEIQIGNQTTLKVILKEDLQRLDEVVIVGYGVQKKSDITGSVSSLSSARLESIPNVNISQAIQGGIAGVSVQTSSAGAEPSESILIRGRNSIKASNAPLVVVDGIAAESLNDINPNDVKSIEVLKDASAAAIYGSRGSNGVILVTTKTGASGKPKFKYSGYTGVQDFANLPRIMNGEEFYKFKMERNPSSMTPSEIEVYESGNWVSWPDWPSVERERPLIRIFLFLEDQKLPIIIYPLISWM